jgi:hypothetical protein
MTKNIKFTKISNIADITQFIKYTGFSSCFYKKPCNEEYFLKTKFQFYFSFEKNDSCLLNYDFNEILYRLGYLSSYVHYNEKLEFSNIYAKYCGGSFFIKKINNEIFVDNNKISRLKMYLDTIFDRMFEISIHVFSPINSNCSLYDLLFSKGSSFKINQMYFRFYGNYRDYILVNNTFLFKECDDKIEFLGYFGFENDSLIDLFLNLHESNNYLKYYSVKKDDLIDSELSHMIIPSLSTAQVFYEAPIKFNSPEEVQLYKSILKSEIKEHIKNNVFTEREKELFEKVEIIDYVLVDDEGIELINPVENGVIVEEISDEDMALFNELSDEVAVESPFPSLRISSENDYLRYVVPLPENANLGGSIQTSNESEPEETYMDTLRQQVEEARYNLEQQIMYDLEQRELAQQSMESGPEPPEPN